MKKLFGSSSQLWKPKNPHSLEYLKYLHNLLVKNPTVTDANRALIVEALRSISEILIWGDQNDQNVFDFFLEKQMLAFFTSIMRQKCGSYVTVQLLQTLNIMFENIRHETSLYFLLSNNYVNNIIEHKFDFSNEEIMAYYISFLKTLSFKLNPDTIHFFFNDQTEEFPLYTEALRFFNHSESMVRIAVRTLTLNVYRLNDAGVMSFIRKNNAVSYFSNLTWYFRNHVIEMDTYLHTDQDTLACRNKLTDLIAEHLDHVHYLNDILAIGIDSLNQVLTEQLMRKLLMPLYIGSLVPELQPATLHVSRVMALFLLTQFFLIINDAALMEQLLSVLLFGDAKDLQVAHECVSAVPDGLVVDSASIENASVISPDDVSSASSGRTSLTTDENIDRNYSFDRNVSANSFGMRRDLSNLSEYPLNQLQDSVYQTDRPLFSCLLSTLRCTSSDYEAVFTLVLLYAVGRNTGVPPSLLEAAQLPCGQQQLAQTSTVPDNQATPGTSSVPSSSTTVERTCDQHLLDRLVELITVACNKDSPVRVVTVDVCLLLLRHMILTSEDFSPTSSSTGYTTASENNNNTSTPEKLTLDKTPLAVSDRNTDDSPERARPSQHAGGWSYLHSDEFVAVVRDSITSLTRQLASAYHHLSDDFLDWFELEFDLFQRRELRLALLVSDADLLIRPKSTDTTQIDLTKRLARSTEDRCRRALRLFFLLRQFLLDLQGITDQQLPLTSPKGCVKINDCLDLSNSDMLACNVVTKGSKCQRFLVTDGLQLILVEPDAKKLGFGVAQFVGFLQDVVMSGQHDDNKALNVVMHSTISKLRPQSRPLLDARFVFDDAIRCMAAKQRLTKGRQHARQYKMDMIAEVLQIPKRRTPPNSRTSATTSPVAFDSVKSHRGKVPGHALRDHKKHKPGCPRHAHKHKHKTSTDSSSVRPSSTSPEPAELTEEAAARAMSYKPSVDVGNDVTSSNIGSSSPSDSRLGSPPPIQLTEITTENRGSFSSAGSNFEEEATGSAGEKQQQQPANCFVPALGVGKAQIHDL